MLKIHNSLTKQKEVFTPRVPRKVGMYVCGMTVYDYCHVGHARVMVVFDVVARYLRASGYDVTYVRNITDIDDKIIKRAAENNEPMGALTERYIQAMHEDSAALGVLPPDHEPRATTSIDEIVDMIGRLVERGYAYHAKNGDVYYDVSRFEHYGALSGKRQARRAELGVPLGSGPPRLAHRVFRHVDQVPRRSLRHPRRRRGPHVPAPRERDRAERGRDRPSLRQLLDAQRLRADQRREDVEVARKFLYRA